jgi:membrane associated rhomboid family serine protease/outer membrane protein assembly factor BamD (BamD/ComL family)
MYFFYYMPVGIDAESRRFPVLTVLFSVLCTLIFFVNRYAPQSTAFDFNNFIYFPGFSGWPAAVAAAFLHYGYVHLIGNLVYLLLFGWYLEDRMGTLPFGLLFLGASLLGNVAQGWYNLHVLHVNMGIIGASGAVSGIMGAALVRFYVSRVKIAYWVFMPLLAYNRAGRVDVPIVFALVLWILLQIARGLAQLEGTSLGVAYMTHLAGFAFGIAFTLATGGWKEARSEAFYVRAQRYLRKGDFFGAQEEFSHYVATRPDDGDAHAQLARVQVQTGDEIGAKASYLKACEILLRSQDRSECEDVYAQALRGFPDFCLSPEPHLDMAYGMERNLKPELALKAYDNFARRYPRHKDAPFVILRAANLHANAFADPARAKRCYDSLIDQYPDDAWADFAREQVRLMV